MPTTGLSKAARIHVSSASPTLVLIGASQQLTAQVTATVQDVAGNTVSGTLYYSSADPSVASVSTSGLITAHEPGITQIEVSTPAFGQSPTVLGPDGTPINGKVYALVNVVVQQGVPVLPSFSFTLSASSVSIAHGGSATVTITQTVTTVGGVGPGPVNYRIANSTVGFDDPVAIDPRALISQSIPFPRTITGNATLVLTLKASNNPQNFALPYTFSTYVYGYTFPTSAGQPLQFIQPLAITVT